MTSVKVTVHQNRVLIPTDTSVGQELLRKVDEGDKIDIKLKDWKIKEDWGNEQGSLYTDIILELVGKGSFDSEGIITQKLPQRVVSKFPEEALTNPRIGLDEDINSPFLHLYKGHLNTEINRLIKGDEKTYAFNQYNELVNIDNLKDTGEDERDVQNIHMEDF